MAHTGFDVFVVYCIGCLELVQNIVEGNLSSVSYMYTIYSMYPSIMYITCQTAFDQTARREIKPMAVYGLGSF